MMRSAASRAAAWSRATAVAADPIGSAGTLVLNVRSDANTFFDAARITPDASDADPVGGWLDLSPAGNHPTQSVNVDRPAWKTNILSGKAILRPDGVNDFLNLPAFALGTIYTIIFAYKPASTMNDVILANSAGFYTIYIDATNIYSHNGGTNVNVAHGMVAGTWYLLGLRRNGTNVRFYKGGTQLGTDQTFAANTSIGNAGSILAKPDATFPSHGDLAHGLIYSTAVADADIGGVLGAVNQYWGNPFF